MAGNYRSSAVICSPEQYSQILVHVVEASIFHREPFNPNKNT